MRQNIFLLSAACFYFLMQTANLALGTPAPFNTDKDISVDESRTVLQRTTVGNRPLEKRNGAIRNNMGQATCDELSTKENKPKGQIESLYKLYSAYCEDDKQYRVECRQYIPHTESPLHDSDSCDEDEICKTKDFWNAWGSLKTEVYCQKQQSAKVKWSGSNVLKSNCSPGITAHDKQGTIMGLSSQFFSDGFLTDRTKVGHAWFQSSKKGKLAENYNGNGLYLQTSMEQGETIQSCFVRATNNDAKYAYLTFAEEDL